MDNQATEPSNSALDMNGAAQAFGALFDSPEIKEKSGEELENEVLEDIAKGEVEAEPVAEPANDDEDNETVTFKADGKTVTLSKAELADSYLNGLRLSDYTKKTMEAADQRKVADAEIQKAQQERNEYAQNLTKMASQLEGALDQHNNINWQELLDSDPVEYLRQQHLFQQRQAAYQQNIQQQQHLQQINQTENQKHQTAYLQSQQEQLLVKVPAWKDNVKASSEKKAIANYLIEEGYDSNEVNNIVDHKAVIQHRKAMLYDAMMAKASAASKKVATVPQKIIRPGVGDSPSNDSRSAAMNRLQKSGTLEDGARAFAEYFK